MAQRSILVVEDDGPLRGMFVRALQAAGYRVYEARNGQEAIEGFDKYGWNVDLVITDMRMPHVGGDMVVAELRRRNPTLKILCVSGYRSGVKGCGLPVFLPGTAVSTQASGFDFKAGDRRTPEPSCCRKGNTGN
jgi:CheY-like chemotaxis protein